MAAPITEYLAHFKEQQEKVVELVQYLYSENVRLTDCLEAKELDHKSSNAAARKAQRELEIMTKKFEELQRQIRRNSYNITSPTTTNATVASTNTITATTSQPASNPNPTPTSNGTNTTNNATSNNKSTDSSVITTPESTPESTPGLSPTANGTTTTNNASTTLINQPDQMAIARLKLLNPRACNEFYLTDSCTRPSCGYSHDHGLTPEEVDALRFLARLNRCNFGSACVNERCYRGHTCQSVREGRCMRAKCPFSEDEHPGVGGAQGKA